MQDLDKPSSDSDARPDGCAAIFGALALVAIALFGGISIARLLEDKRTPYALEDGPSAKAAEVVERHILGPCRHKGALFLISSMRQSDRWHQAVGTPDWLRSEFFALAVHRPLYGDI